MTNNQDPIDQDHPLVQEVQQIVTNHGWLILPTDAIDLITETKQALAAYDHSSTRAQSAPSNVEGQRAAQPAQAPQPGVPTQQAAPTPPVPSNHERTREAEKYIRAALPDRLHTPDGDKPEIPDDLYEEIAAILADHHGA